MTFDLEAWPSAAAAAIEPVFHKPTRERYIRFLQAMYHYTSQSEHELRYAATLDPTMRSFFETLAAEESHHYRLAEADLRALNVDVDPVVPPAVLAMRDFWMSKGPGEVYALLGALFVFENVAAHVSQSAVESLASLRLTPLQTRFVMVHLSEDEVHGARVEEQCSTCPKEKQDSMVEGAKRATTLWADMHLSVLEDRA